jgi:large subunit ribosomal protein L15e
MKSMYGFIRDAWKTPERSYVKSLMWQRLQTWRREPSVVRIERPTRLDRARSLGYKAKQGVITARVRTWRGGRRKQRPRGGRRTKHLGVNRLTARKSSQRIAEERASRKFPNLEVLNSYWVGQDGKSKWYDIILVDTIHPRILSEVLTGWRLHRGALCGVKLVQVEKAVVCGKKVEAPKKRGPLLALTNEEEHKPLPTR